MRETHEARKGESLCCPICWEHRGKLSVLDLTRPARRARDVPYVLVRSYSCAECGTRFASAERVGLGVMRRAIGVKPIARPGSSEEKQVAEGQEDEGDEAGESAGPEEA